jgi:hypothetical protein
VDGGAKSYSAHGRMGTEPPVIVIDEGGIVRHRHDHLLGLDYQLVDDLKRALDALPAPTRQPTLAASRSAPPAATSRGRAR